MMQANFAFYNFVSLTVVSVLIVIERGAFSFCLSPSSFRSSSLFRSRIFQARKSQGDSLTPERPPIPVMPSDQFRKMASAQLELLANSLSRSDQPSQSKVESMALYLPQENVISGQLEFTPVVLYPDPMSERVFIASDAGSGQAPTLPKTLTKLPGFTHATTLLPGYPMISSTSEANPGVGEVEEVMCDPWSKNKCPALSVPLLSGSQTVGVLLVSPELGSSKEWITWTEFDRQQVSTAGQSLSMALSMDSERNILQAQNEAFREGLSNSLHQVKNPLQALRTYGKILQLQVAKTEGKGGTSQLLELAERLMVQSDRVVDLMHPMDKLVQNLERPSLLALNPAKNDITPHPLAIWEQPATKMSWENNTREFNRGDRQVENGTVIEFAIQKDSFDGSSKQKEVDSAVEPEERQSSGISMAESSTVVGVMEIEMTFITDVLDPIFSAFQALQSERGIRFDITEETNELPGVMVAPRALQEAVSNVLDNAFKYVVLTKAGSPFLRNPSPRVRVRMFANDDPPGVTLIVEDNGPGIRVEDREKIFQRGFRSETTSSIDGTGIGLDISQALVKRMGGVLELAAPGEFENSLDGTVMKFMLVRRQNTS